MSKWDGDAMTPRGRKITEIRLEADPPWCDAQQTWSANCVVVYTGTTLASRQVGVGENVPKRFGSLSHNYQKERTRRVLESTSLEPAIVKLWLLSFLIWEFAILLLQDFSSFYLHCVSVIVCRLPVSVSESWARGPASMVWAWCDRTAKLKLKLSIMAIIWTHQAH